MRIVFFGRTSDTCCLVSTPLLARALHLFLAAVWKTGWLFLPLDPLPRQILCIKRSGNQQNEVVGPAILVNSPGQRTTNAHYLSTTHTRECSLTQIRTLDLAFSVKESNKYWYLQAIEVSAAKERGERRRGQERRVWQRNGSGGGERCVQKKKKTGLQSVQTHPVKENPRPHCLESVGAAHNLELAVIRTAFTFSPSYLHHNKNRADAHTFSIHTIAVDNSRPQ